ncbi:MAG: T9SS type A sorting domain-containing protein [Candidatus Electryonea clarkiae]|nr:T9SS type A sorting domain-containing protein [Candidatus Electryonea clarkiae]MDP8288016.1 T9SS type A sorting domain-containing protein [Candidatus Electryonea clarkiae]
MKTQKRLRNYACVSFLFISTISFARFNVWEPENGIAVREGPHIPWYREDIQKVAQNDDGEYCVVWTEFVDGSQEVFAQLFDADCNAQWDDGGIQITDGELIQNEPMVISAGEYGWYICWRDWWIDEEFRNRYDVRFQILNCEGVPQWDEEGLNLSPDNAGPLYGYYNNKLFFPSDNGCFFALWWNETGVYTNRFDHNGSPLWDDYVRVAGSKRGLEISTDLQGGLMILFQGSEFQGTLINRVSPDGELLWAEYYGIQLHQDRFDYGMNLVPDGYGGAFVTWKIVTYLDNQIYGQHIDSEGNLQWDIEGELLVPEDSYEGHTKSVYISPGNFALSWITKNEHNTQEDLRVQRIESVDGEAVARWGEDEFGLIFSEEIPYKNWISPDGEGGVVVAWSSNELTNYQGDGFELQRIAEDGTICWNSPASLRSNEAYHTKITPFVCQEQVIGVWRDPRTNQGGIYTQAFDFNTGGSLTEDAFEVVEGLEGTGYQPKIIHSGSSAYVCWVDSRLTVNGRLPYMQRIDLETGESQWDDNGINIVPGFDTGREVDLSYYVCDIQLFPDNDDGVIAAWIQHDWSSGADDRYFAQKIDRDGNLLWGDQGYHTAIENEVDYCGVWNTHAAATSDGGIVLIYQVYSRDIREIRAQRLDSDGNPTWNEPYGIQLQEDDDFYEALGLVQLEGGDLIFFYSEIPDEWFDVIYAIRIDSDGEFVWDEPLEVSVSRRRAEYLDPIQVDENIVVLVPGTRHEMYDVHCIGEDGELRWDEESVTFRLGHILQGHLAPGINDDFWFVRNNNSRCEAYHYNLDAELLTEEPIIVAEGIWSGVNAIVPDDAGGVYLFSRMETGQVYIHLDYNGEVVSDEYNPGGDTLTDAPYLHSYFDYVSDGDGGALVTWNYCADRLTEQTGQDFDVYAMRIHDGAVGVNREESSAIPSEISISPAYPNPFNPNTTIRIGLPQSNELNLSVYNILGQQVSQLATGRYNAGYHNFVFYADEFSSGIYFIRASVPGKLEEIRKVVLLK